MKGIALIVAGICVCRTFDPTFDIIGFWPVLIEFVGAMSGMIMVGAGVLVIGAS